MVDIPKHITKEAAFVQLKHCFYQSLTPQDYIVLLKFFSLDSQKISEIRTIFGLMDDRKALVLHLEMLTVFSVNNVDKIIAAAKLLNKTFLEGRLQDYKNHYLTKINRSPHVSHKNPSNHKTTSNHVYKLTDAQLDHQIQTCESKLQTLLFEKRRRKIYREGEGCIICCEQPPNVVFLDCKHLCVCSRCTDKLKQCPICRTPIKKSLKVFL